MKVAILSSFPEKKCGIAHFSKQLVDAMRRTSGVDVVVIGDLESTLADYQVNFRSPFLFRRVSQILREEDADVLYIWHEYWLFGPTNLGFVLTLPTSPCPVVTNLASISSTDPGVPTWERMRAIIIERWVSSISKKIVVDPAVRAYQLRFIEVEKVAKVPLGIQPKQREWIDHERKIILFFGVISPHKGVENLIKASQYLDGVEIVIAGKPNMNMHNILKLVEKFSSRIPITLDLGWISNEKKEEYFKKADVVVLPYTRIGLQSGVFFEALSYGIPCVVSRGSMMEPVATTHGVGVAVDPSPEGVARGVLEILSHHDEYRENVARYQKVVSWERVASMLLSVLRDASRR